MLDEKTVGLIPRIILQAGLGPKEYAVLVTDRRSIFILGPVTKAGTGSALGGATGAAAAGAAISKTTFDYEQSDADLPATDPKNFVVPHESLEKIEVKKAKTGPFYRFNMEYRTPNGKDKKVRGQLVPPGEPFRGKKQDEGGENKACYDYAKKAREVYQKALRAIAFEALTEWNL